MSAYAYLNNVRLVPANFDLVRRIGRTDGQAVLVAVAIDVDEAGEYRVRSCYLIAAKPAT